MSQSNKHPTGITKVEVTPGSQHHEILVEENAEPAEHPNGSMSERRKAPNPVNVQVGSAAGGLIGWPATIANMSAVGFVLVLITIMYMDFRSSVKEERANQREENRMTREENSKANSLMLNAIDKQTTAMTIQTTTTASSLQGMRSSFDSVVVSNQSLINEIKADRAIHRSQLDDVIKELKAANAKKCP